MTSRWPMTREQRTPLACGQRPALPDRLPSRSGSASIPSPGRASGGSSCRAGTGPRPACCARPARWYGSAGCTPVTGRPATDDADFASPDAADPGGARHHLDLGVTVPTLDGITLQLDSLFSTLGGWSLRLRATPRWFRYRDDGNRKWSPVAIIAEDDRGHSYCCTFGGSSGRDGHEYLTLEFRPRLDPVTRRLRLTCTGSTDQVSLDVDLPSAPVAPGWGR